MLNAHVAKLMVELKSRSIQRKHFPKSKANRRKANLLLGELIGEALAEEPSETIRIQGLGLYGQIILPHSQDAIGVMITPEEWLMAIDRGRKRSHDR